MSDGNLMTAVQCLYAENRIRYHALAVGADVEKETSSSHKIATGLILTMGTHMRRLNTKSSELTWLMGAVYDERA